MHTIEPIRAHSVHRKVTFTQRPFP